MYKIGTAKEAKSLIGKIPRRVCIEAYNIAKIIDQDIWCGRSSRRKYSHSMNTLLSSFIAEEGVRLFAASVILAIEVYRTAKNQGKRKK